MTEKNCNEWKPTNQQMKMAELLANPNDTRTKDEKCKQLGIAPSTLWRWEQRKEYREYVNNLVNNYTDSEVPNAWKKLIKRMDKDTQAIKLFFELKDMYRDKKEVSGPDGNAITIKLEGDLEEWSE